MDKVMEISQEYVRNKNFNCNFSVLNSLMHIWQRYEWLYTLRKSKHALFGEDKLGRDIILSDLNEDDMGCLKSSYLQILNNLDFGNRKVVSYYKAVSDCYSDRENLLRSSCYDVTNVISSNEDVQKLGVVNVVYNLGGFPRSG